MKWTKITLETTTSATDLVSAMLDELGIEGIEIEDKIPLSKEDKAKMFIDILPDLGPDDGVAELSFYTDLDRDLDELLDCVNKGLDELEAFTTLGSRKLTVSETEDKDWINNWKEFFKPFRVDDTIVIKPTWENLTETKPEDLVIEIDPGTAFGTGSHETTKLCIIDIKKYLKKNDAILDIGCGSGILSIAAIKLGASKAVGIDIDENASRISVENAEVNRIPEDQIHFLSGNVIDNRQLRESIGLKKYDVVVANILADIIIPLSAVAAEFMKENSFFISSGIINTKKEAVCEALNKNHFTIVEIREMGDWVSIVAQTDKISR